MHNGEQCNLPCPVYHVRVEATDQRRTVRGLGETPRQMPGLAYIVELKAVETRMRGPYCDILIASVCVY